MKYALKKIKCLLILSSIVIRLKPNNPWYHQSQVEIAERGIVQRGVDATTMAFMGNPRAGGRAHGGCTSGSCSSVARIVSLWARRVAMEPTTENPTMSGSKTPQPK